MKNSASIALLALAAVSLLAARPAQAQTAGTSFFLTSNGIGNGGNLGGLAGADNHCQSLARPQALVRQKPGAPICRPRRPMVSLR
jgi:hypothetical protein